MESNTDLNAFRKSLKFTLKWEVGDKPNGGYTNDPDDPGGETKWGIAKRYHPDEDIKNMTPERAAELYYSDYWVKSGAANMPFPFSAVVFDSSVNPGLGFVQKALQNTTTSTPFIEARKQYYIQKINQNPRKMKYWKGWMNRLNDLKKFVEVNTPTD